MGWTGPVSLARTMNSSFSWDVPAAGYTGLTLSLLSGFSSAVDLIRSGGKKLRFLVAKSDMDIAKKISSSLSPSS